jgi:hypothetical protein
MSKAVSKAKTKTKTSTNTKTKANSNVPTTEPKRAPGARADSSEASSVRPASAAASRSGLDAALAVLAGARAPMNVQTITKEILARKLWTTAGKTPHATIAAAIMREIASKGTASRFVRAGRGLFAASDSATLVTSKASKPDAKRSARSAPSTQTADAAR